MVNRPQTEDELAVLRRILVRAWIEFAKNEALGLRTQPAYHISGHMSTIEAATRCLNLAVGLQEIENTPHVDV